MLCFKEYERMYGIHKGGYGQGYEVCCVLVLIYFSVVVCRMVLRMGASLGARAPAEDR